MNGNKDDMETLVYNQGHNTIAGYFMPQEKPIIKTEDESFGERLARLRRASGYSLRELAAELKVSPRMLVYYEKHADHHQAALWPRLAKVLGVSSDQLFGIEKVKSSSGVRDNRLWRRFSQVEKLPPAERRPIIQIIDAVLKGKKAS